PVRTAQAAAAGAAAAVPARPGLGSRRLPDGPDRQGRADQRVFGSAPAAGEGGCGVTTLTKQARETIKWWWFGETAAERTTIAGYIRYNGYSNGKWGGDRCGCPDDRCIGYHHQDETDCGCLEVV